MRDASGCQHLHAIPAPGWLLVEIPLWTVLLFCALVPGSRIPWFEVADIPMRASEALVAGAAALYLLAGASRRPFSAFAVRLALPFLLAVGYGALTMLGDDDPSREPMLATLVFAAASPILAFSFIRCVPEEVVPSFLLRMTWFLAIVSAIYAAESVFALGLRSELGRTPLSDFGIERVRGPLFGAATGYFALLPAFGLAVEDSLFGIGRKWLGHIVAGVFLIAIVGMGSRAGLLLTAAFLPVLLWSLRRTNRKAMSVLLLALLGGLATVTIFSQAHTDRLRSLDDSGRESTHRMAAEYLASEPLVHVFRGAGYGSVWPWYLRDVHAGERVAAGDNTVWTPYGTSLYHPHSTAIEMAVELGVPGMALFAAIAWAILKLVAESRRQGQWQALAAGLAVASIGFFFDLFLFKNTTVNLIWWIYAAGLCTLLGTDGKRERCASE